MNDSHPFLADLAARRRFGMKPGLDSIRETLERLGNPQDRLAAIHIAGTNGKGATAAILDAALRHAGLRVARYTSPHLVRLNERFFLDGAPIDDATLENAASRVAAVAPKDLTFFEALTAVAFLVFAEAGVDCAILETGLGGRMDATNVCKPVLAVLTRIGLDHCDWLGDTIESIAAEKAGIIKPGIPVVVGANEKSARAVISEVAHGKAAQAVYAPDMTHEADIPPAFPLGGAFNRENALTALAALRVLRSQGKTRSWEADIFKKLAAIPDPAAPLLASDIVWPGRFQKIGRFLIDGAHNPPAARALANALAGSQPAGRCMIAGFCSDKDIDEILHILKPLASKAYAVKTSNPRSLPPDELAAKMAAASMDATPCDSLADAIARSQGETLICGSLFLAGEALVALGAYPWPADRIDPNENLIPL